MDREELIKRYNAGERNFTKVNLFGVDLFEVDLSYANFTGANLTQANLSHSNLTGANLQGTCLDPQAPVPKTDLSELETDGDYVIGYRTQISICRGDTLYVPGNHYVAPYFSICTETECHPGIYLSTLAWIKRIYPYYYYYYVKVKALKSETLKVGDKYRAKQIWVIENV